MMTIIVLVAFAMLSLSPALAASAIEAGGLVDQPVMGPLGPNLVANGSFENGRTGWTGRAQDSSAVIDMSDGRTSLRVSGASGPILTQRIKAVPGWYRIRARVKVTGVTTEKAGIQVRLGAGDFVRCGGGRTRTIGGTTDWVVVEARHIPILCAGEIRVMIVAYHEPDGTMWIDDIEVRRELPAPIDYFVRYPNYRGYLFDDRRQSVTVRVTAAPGSLAGPPCHGCRAEIRLEAEGTGGVVAAAAFPVDAGSEFIERIVALDASRAPNGRYLLQARLVGGDGAVRFGQTPYRIVKLPAAARAGMNVWVDSDHALVLGGRRTFPIGIFDTSGSSPNPQRWVERLAPIARAQMNTYINYWQGNAPQRVLEALLKGAQTHGIFYLHTVNLWYEDHPHWPARLECDGATAGTVGADSLTACMARTLGPVAGLAGWYTVDEEPAPKVDRVFHQYRILRANDPRGIALIAQNRPNELSKWRDAGDVFAVDPFPIYGKYPNDYPTPPLAPLEMVTDWVEKAQAAVERSRPVWGDIQFFKPTAKSHWPTYEELRAMSYMAIVAGAKGLIYWSYGAKALARVKDPAKREEYWQRLVRVTQEIRELEPVLLSPDRPEVIASVAPGAPIRVLAKHVEGVRYVMAVNNAPEPVTATFTLREPTRMVRVHKEDREIAVGGTTFADTFRPYGVHVYVIQAAE